MHAAPGLDPRPGHRQTSRPADASEVAEAGIPSRGSRMKVLVADDNRDAALSLGALLEMSGHEVLIAHDGEEALQTARQSMPDAMILDIGMPRLTGDQVARAVRGEPWGARAFLVAVTGWGEPE